jgi:hypothetical protein
MKNAKEPAFATSGTLEDYLQKGLIKREYFAALAMQGILANSIFAGATHKTTASLSVKSADALLNELEKQTINS